MKLELAKHRLGGNKEIQFQGVVKCQNIYKLLYFISGSLIIFKKPSKN